MNKLKLILTLVLVALTAKGVAQYTQIGKSKSELMLKLELGYAPFIGNMGEAGEHGFYLNKFHNAANFNAMLGANISQDWFLGGGVGYSYFHNLRQGVVTPLMGAQLFIDFDFRPIWQGLMGVDYQPATIKWSPLVGGRVGASYLMGPGEPEGYDPTITPMLEAYGGVNWYYRHGLRNMEHNFHAFYATIGVAFMQQTIFLPVRVGWRW